MTILSKLYSVAFKNYSYKAKNWRTVLPCNAKKNSDTFLAGCVLYRLVSLCSHVIGQPAPVGRQPGRGSVDTCARRSPGYSAFATDEPLQRWEVQWCSTG